MIQFATSVAVLFLSQAETATLSGLMLENRDAVIRDATVELKNSQTGKLAAKSQQNPYRLTVPPGQYDITVAGGQWTRPYRRAPIQLTTGSQQLNLYPVFRTGIETTLSRDQMLPDPPLKYVKTGDALIQFTSSSEHLNTAEYRGSPAVLTLDFVTIRANFIIVNQNPLRIAAEGPVRLNISNEQTTADRLELDPKSGTMRLTTAANTIEQKMR